MSHDTKPSTTPTRRVEPTPRTDSSTPFISGRDLGRIGTAMLLLGLVFLYRWGVTEGWIQEEARIVLGGLVSVGLLGAGLAVSKRNPAISALAEGAGLAGLFMTAFAAHHVYGLLTETAAFVQLSAVSALAFGLAIAQRRESMAVVGVIGAITAPLLIGGQLDVVLGDAGYLSVVVLTVGAILYRESWRSLFAVTAIGTGLVGVMAAGVLDIDRIVASPGELVVLSAAAAIGLFGGPIAAVYSGRLDPDDALANVAGATVTLGAYAGAILAWGIDRDRPSWAVVALGLAALHVGVAATLPVAARSLRWVQFVPAATFLVVAAGLTFDGEMLVLVWSAQAAGLVIAGRRDHTGAAPIIGGVAYGFLALVAMVRLVEPGAGTPVLNGDALAILGVFLLAFAIAASLPNDTPDERMVRGGMQLYGYAAVLGWQYAELGRLEAGQGAVSAAWAVTGVALIAVGWRARTPMRNVGIATLLVVVAKLFIVDLAEASPGWKILLFLGLGGTLLGLGFLLGDPDGERAPTERAPTERPQGPDAPWPPAASPQAETPPEPKEPEPRENVSTFS